MTREFKTVKESSIVTYRLMMPSDVNPAGNVYGGTIIKFMDEAAGIVAFRHARKNVVTASIDRVDFFHPVRVGDLLMLKASVNYVGKTSMEVGVRIETEDPLTGKIKHIGSSYLTFVALNEEGKPTVVPDIILRTGDEKRRRTEGAARRDARLNLLGRSS